MPVEALVRRKKKRIARGTLSGRIRLSIGICCLLQLGLSSPGLAQTPGQPAQRRQAKLQWPDFSQGATPSMMLWEATDHAFAASDAFVDAHIVSQDPKERPLFIGLGRWRALRDLGRVREDWKHLADTAQAQDRRVDEWQSPKALLDPAPS